MDSIILINAITIFFALIILSLIFLLFKKQNQNINESNNQEINELKQQLSQTNLYLDRFISNTSKNIENQNQNNIRVIQQVTQSQREIAEELVKKLSQLENTNQEVLEFTQNLKKLENILVSQKTRGILGEKILENILSNILPTDIYKTQYQLLEGHVVDVAIFVNNIIIPIDSKFPLESYNKIFEENDTKLEKKLFAEFFSVVKKRIDECSKYIQPSLGTSSFVFMFVPADGVYNNLINFSYNGQTLISYALSKNVIIVSPMSLFAYLQTVIQGLRMLNVEKNISFFIQNLETLSKSLLEFQIANEELGKSIDKVGERFNKTERISKKIGSTLKKITQS